MFKPKEQKPIEIPRRVTAIDYWPGQCSSCYQKTDNPESFVLYTAQQISEDIRSYGGYKKISYSNILEHPCRLCSNCGRASRDFGRWILIGMIPAVLIAAIVYLTLQDFMNAIWWGLGTFIVALFLVYSRQADRSYKNSRKNVINARISKADTGKYLILNEKEYLLLKKN